MPTQSQDTLAVNGGSAVRTAPWPARKLFGTEEKAAAVALLDHCIETGEAYGYLGPEEAGYCAEFVQWLTGKADGGYADMVNSGSTAVYVALRALNLEPFSEVIVSPLTDSGGFMPITLLNCIPVVADTAPDSFNIGPDQIEACITEHTSAIIVTHIAGKPCDMDPIMALARKHNLFVVEDCAQCHGSTYKGKKLGTFGDIAAFSTMSGKHHATGAQGGVVFTKDESRYYEVRRAADRGKPVGDDPGGDEGCVLSSLNFNQDEMGATIGRVQLRKLPAFVESRRAFANAVADGCKNLQAITVDGDTPDGENSYWFMFLRINETKLSADRDTIVSALKAEGIPGGVYWFAPPEHTWFKQRRVFGTSQYPWSSPDYKGDANRPVILDNIIDAGSRRIRVPMHENCGAQEAADIVAALEKIEAAYLK